MAEPITPMVVLGVKANASAAFDLIELPGPIKVDAALPFRGNDAGVGGLLRDGWVLFHARSTHANLAARDGDLRSLTPLPKGDATAAADPTLVILMDDQDVRLVDADGTVLQACHLPRDVAFPSGSTRFSGPVVGQRADGLLITSQGVFDWDGTPVEEFDGGLQCEAVLAGRFLCMSSFGRLVLRDVETGAEELIEVEPRALPVEQGTNPSLTASLWEILPEGPHRPRERTLWVLRPGEPPLEIETDSSISIGCWIDDVHYVRGGDRPAVIDTVTGRTRQVRGVPSWPELSVTGRFTAAMFEADAPAPPPPRRRKGDKKLPKAAADTMRAGDQLDYDVGDAEAGAVLLARSPELVELPVDSDGQAWSVTDPHRGEGGHYLVLAESLVEECEGYEPLGLLVWLPREGCFGSWDGDHHDLVTFPGTRWPQVLLDPIRYLDAVWGPGDDQPYLDPTGRYPYVAADGTVTEPSEPVP